MNHPALDARPGRAVVGINLQAPQRVIVESLEEMVRQAKQELGIDETRRRDDKLAEYLAIWDRREGWVEDHYDAQREQTLQQIAKELSIGLSTAANRYRSAFRLIIGHEYSPQLWALLVGALKVQQWFGPEKLPKLLLRRPWRSPKPRLVTETVLQSTAHDPPSRPFRITEGVSESELDSVDLMLDIQDLISQGSSDEEIVSALELSSPDAKDLIAFFRDRQRDTL